MTSNIILPSTSDLVLTFLPPVPWRGKVLDSLQPCPCANAISGNGLLTLTVIPTTLVVSANLARLWILLGAGVLHRRFHST